MLHALTVISSVDAAIRVHGHRTGDQVMECFSALIVNFFGVLARIDRRAPLYLFKAEESFALPCDRQIVDIGASSPHKVSALLHLFHEHNQAGAIICDVI